MSNPLLKASRPDAITTSCGKEFHRLTIHWVKKYFLLDALDQGCPTFHLPWATLKDENLVWAAHTFGLGRMGGSPSHPPQPCSKHTYRQLRSQTAEAASFDSGGFMEPGGGPSIDGDGAMQSRSSPPGLSLIHI